MAFGSGSSTTRQAGGATLTPDLDVNDWHEPPQQPRDVKKLFLVGGLGLLSWVATYVGMLELIEANMGDLPLVHKLIIGFSVAMLMTMVIWLLDQIFSPIGVFNKLVYIAGYVFLTIISIGFGFGFYWKVLESRSEASRSAEGAVGQVQTSLFAASTRLDQLHQTLDGLTAMSTQKAELERTSGTSCPNSKPGDGPRRKLRDDDAQRFKFAAEFVQGRVGAVKGEMGALNGDLAKIVGDDKSIIDVKSGTRNEFMKGLSRKLDMTVTGFNAFRSDPQLKQIRNDLGERADRTTFPDTRGQTFSCPDAQLAAALKGVVRAIDELPLLEKPKIAAVEGSEATIEAFRRLTATFYGLLSFKMPPSADELRELQKKAVQSVEATPQQIAQQQRLMSSDGVGLSKRDYVPLAIALFVDLCLLLVSMGRPINRLGGLVPKMREAERGPVIQILSRFNDIHRDPEIRRNFEVFRHVVFDFHGDYYVAVPLDAPFGVGQRMGRNGRPEYFSQSPTDVSDHQVEAHILANLFTSFEKERIFARVYSPFLTTRTIQKRLARQGSKFAQAKAFRIYRFRDGAWSEIILGAVMGAARRVEAEKRARNLAEGHRLPGERGPATASNAMPNANPGAGVPPLAQQHMGAAYPQGPRQPVSGRGPQAPAAVHPATAHMARPPQMPSHMAHQMPAGIANQAERAEPRTAASYLQRGPVHGQPQHPVAERADGAAQAHVVHPVPGSEPSPDHVSKFGPYAAHVASPEAHVVVQVPQHATQHANNNTSPSAQRRGLRTGMSALAAATAEAARDASSDHKVIAMPGVRPLDSIIPDVREPYPGQAVDGSAAQARFHDPATATVHAHAPYAAAGEDSVTYELKRETLTATVPVSRAALPEALFAHLRQARQLGETQASVHIVADSIPVESDARAQTAPQIDATRLIATAADATPANVERDAPSGDGHRLGDDDLFADIENEPDDDDVIVLGPSSDDLTVEERATLARFAKRPA